MSDENNNVLMEPDDFLNRHIRDIVYVLDGGTPSVPPVGVKDYGGSIEIFIGSGVTPTSGGKGHPVVEPARKYMLRTEKLEELVRQYRLEQLDKSGLFS